tara:strand:+ start:1470 stop:2567 length:1098 start_codon:yes stop_codon:yes gene_type:complete
MPDITKGKTFSSGDTVTAADLNSLLDDAVINNNAITNSKIADGAVDNAAVSGTAGIGFSKLASLSTGQVLAGNGGTPTATTLSGDVTIAADGAVTIADDAVTQAKIADDAVGADQIADGAVDGAAIAMGSDAQGDILYYDGTSYVRLGAGTSGQILQSGGTEANPSWVNAPVTPSVTEFTTAGSSNFDATNANLIHVLVIGGGGGSTAKTNGGHGGIISDWIDVSSVTGNISVTVGTGGSAGHSSGQGEHNYAAGGTGGASSFGSYLTANGGGGGSRSGTNNTDPHNPGDQGSVSTSRGAALDHTHLTNNYNPSDTSATDPDVYALAAGTNSYGAGAVAPGCTSNCHNTAGNAGSSGAVIVRVIG